MATIGDYVNDRIASLRLPINQIGIETMFLKAEITAETEMDLSNINALEVQILSVVPDLLLIPDRKQGDSAITWDKDAIINWYNIRTAELGLENVLAIENSINDASDIW